VSHPLENLRRGDVAPCNRACQRLALPFELRACDCDGEIHLRYVNYDREGGSLTRPKI
jgi:hypothetical protein